MFTHRSFYLLIVFALFVVTACAPQSVPASEQPKESLIQQVWSTTGDPNPFNQSHGTALDPQGNLYVMDSLNHRIQKLNGDGNFITMWGSFGDGDGQFKCLNYCMVAVDGQGNVYITDHNNYRIQKFDGDGKFLAKWGSEGDGDGQFRHPFGIAVDQEGNVYVTDVGQSLVQKFDGNGKFLMKWGSSGIEDGQFSSDLHDITVDAQGNIYVTDRSNGLQKFDNNGNFLAKIDTCGDEKRMSTTAGITLDSQGNLYVYDRSNVRICIYDNNGQYLKQWDGSGSADGPVSRVDGIEVDQQGNIYVSEPFNGRVRKFSWRELGLAPAPNPQQDECFGFSLPELASCLSASQVSIP